MKKYMLKSQFGKTMMETMLVLGIIATVATMLMAAVSKMFDKLDASQSISDFTTLANNIYKRYSVEEDYSNLSFENIKKESVAPFKMINANGNLINSSGDTVSVSKPSDYDASFINDVFYISIPNINKPRCLDYLNIEWFSENTAQLKSIYVIADKSTSAEKEFTFEWSVDDSIPEDKRLPVTINGGINACGAKNEILWEFY